MFIAPLEERGWRKTSFSWQVAHYIRVNDENEENYDGKEENYEDEKNYIADEENNHYNVNNEKWLGD